MKIKRVGGGVTELVRNKRKGLKLKEKHPKTNGSCNGCFLFEIDRHCTNEEFICDNRNIIYEKYTSKNLKTLIMSEENR